jgi:outer membrane protein TolC
MGIRLRSLFAGLILTVAHSAWAAGGALSLEELYQRAESRSPRIIEFKEYLDASESDISEAKSGFFPQLTLSGSSRVNQYGANAYNGSVQSPAYAVGVSTWNLFDGRKTTNNVVSREYSRDAARQRLMTAQAELAREVLDSLIEIQRLKTHRAAFDRLLKQSQEISKSIQSQIEVDQGRSSELLSLNTKVLQISVQEADLIRRELELKVRLEKLFGDSDLRRIPVLRLDEVLSIEDIHQVDFNLVPNLAAIRAEAESAKALVKTVSAQNYPSINWVIQKSTQKDILDRDTPIYTAITFSIDLFKGFGITNAERAAASRAGGAQSRYDHAQREFSVQLKGWGAQIKMLQEQVRKLAEIESGSFRLLEVAYRRYEVARATPFELLDSEQSYYSAQVSHANSRAERDQLYARITTESGLHRRVVGPK